MDLARLALVDVCAGRFRQALGPEEDSGRCGDDGGSRLLQGGEERHGVARSQSNLSAERTPKATPAQRGQMKKSVAPGLHAEAHLAEVAEARRSPDLAQGPNEMKSRRRNP